MHTQMFGKLNILIHNAGKLMSEVSARNAGTSGGTRSARGSHSKPKRRSHLQCQCHVSGISDRQIDARTREAEGPESNLRFAHCGSIQKILGDQITPPPLFFYGSPKAALNNLMAWYAKQFPKWKMNAVCPGARATSITKLEERDDTRPSLGTMRVMQLVQDGLDGVTGTFSDSGGPIPI
jgi:NAD(P)-dependent dehydrogenase (short-subunit alcohol dehydrogenase family)